MGFPLLFASHTGKSNAVFLLEVMECPRASLLKDKGIGRNWKGRSWLWFMNGFEIICDRFFCQLCMSERRHLTFSGPWHLPIRSTNKPEFPNDNSSSVAPSFICWRAIVHNENDEDKDVKELFQQLLKPFWASVPVVRMLTGLLPLWLGEM